MSVTLHSSTCSPPAPSDKTKAMLSSQTQNFGLSLCVLCVYRATGEIHICHELNHLSIVSQHRSGNWGMASSTSCAQTEQGFQVSLVVCI
jgi:hypothetical protein